MVQCARGWPEGHETPVCPRWARPAGSLAPKRGWAFSNLTSIIRQHMSTYVDLVRFLCDPDKALLHYKPPSHCGEQLHLSFS